MARTSVYELKEMVDKINETLKRNKYKIVLGQRYGYYAIDLYTKRGAERTLISGLHAGEAKLVLSGMLYYMWIKKAK